jgi:hypothetical protein
MAKKHKHEEHQNHERWVISYADMVTLLFALFVVLYALGEVKLSKLKELKKSIQFAFHFEGSGKTKDEGLHDKAQEGGELNMAALLLNAQKGPMKEFLAETLPQQFRETTGQSLEIVQTDDTIAFRGPLSAFFAPRSRQLRGEIHGWLTALVEGANSFTSEIRVQIRAPKTVIGRRANASLYSGDFCMERLGYLQLMLGLMPGIVDHQIQLEFRYLDRARARAGDWEDVADISFAFSNRK